MLDPRPPFWLRVLVRLDFVAAVALTVVAPLIFLARAITRPAQLPFLVRYWRVSSSLMITVYLLAGNRPYSYICGTAARLLIAQTLAEHSYDNDVALRRWRRLTWAYCLLGAAANLPMLIEPAGARVQTLRAAYREPPCEFAALLHPRVPAERLAQAGDRGLLAFLFGATLVVAGRHRHSHGAHSEATP